MDTKGTEKGQQDPGNIVINGALLKFHGSIPVHAGNKKQINNPADEKEAQGEKIDGSGDWATIVKTMGTQKSENPEYVANGRGVGFFVIAFHHYFL